MCNNGKIIKLVLKLFLNSHVGIPVLAKDEVNAENGHNNHFHINEHLNSYYICIYFELYKMSLDDTIDRGHF